MARCPAAALVLTLALSSDVWAGPPTETLQAVAMTVNQLLDERELREDPPKLLTAIRNVVGDCFDVQEAARLALGREWHSRTSTERDEFVRLFGEVLANAYVGRIASRVNVHRGLAIRYLGESIDADRATVRTAIESRDGNETRLEYRMIQHSHRWAVYDVQIDGVSLVANYRAQFGRIIHRSSYPELVARLKTSPSGTPPVSPVASEGPEGARATQPASQDAKNPAPRLGWDGGDGANGVTEITRRPPPEFEPGVPTTRTAPATTTSYWIQLGAFTDADACDLASRLLQRSLPVAIDAVTIPTDRRGQLFLRVRVGPFLDRAEAASKLRDLQPNGYQPFIARERD